MIPKGQLRMIIEKVQEQRRILHFFQLQEAGSALHGAAANAFCAGNDGKPRCTRATILKSSATFLQHLR